MSKTEPETWKQETDLTAARGKEVGGRVERRGNG